MGVCVWWHDQLTNFAAAQTLAATLGQDNPFRYRGYYFDTESGLYYLQSRYYNPTTQRYLNSDAVTDGGAGLIGNNLFAYAANNPVNNSDPTGQALVKDAIKWFAKNVAKPAVKTLQKIGKKIDGTYTKGISINGSPSIFNFNGQAGLSIDTKGNCAIQGFFGGGFTTGTPSASVTIYHTITNAPNIDRLLDESYQLGGSAIVPVAVVPVAVGAEVNIIPYPSENVTYYGKTMNSGIGFPPGAELHAEWGYTGYLSPTFNIIDVADGIYKKIMEW